MSEDPLGHVPALLPGLFIREAEMDAVVDADIDRISQDKSEKRSYVRVFGLAKGCWLKTVKVMWSVPKKSASVWVSAPTMLLAPEV